MRAKKKPLYRKVNTRARGVHHLYGGDYRNSRHKDSVFGMRQGVQRGLDYTPLFKFLLSKADSPWSEVHREAVARLDKEEPIFFLVALDYDLAREVVRVGESTYFSGLYVDADGVLRIVNPELNEGSLAPQCKCCTHTFNGIPFTREYDAQLST